MGRSLLALSALLIGSVALATPQPAESLEAAMRALRGGDAERAAAIATSVLANGGGDRAGALWTRANARERLGELALAAADYEALSELIPGDARVLVALGGARFKLGDATGAIDAFDGAVRIDGSLAPQLWQRGIAHYYAGRYEDGARQFEIHRTVNSRDVENSVWHFLCVAATDGLGAARAALIPVTGDRRVPMGEILELFAGEKRPADVLEAAERARRAGQGPGPVFYAHLYLGLYHEAAGDGQRAAEHIGRAVELPLDGSYMWHVARVHQALGAGR